jgi:tryptophanyl-tRNA synthetase
LADPIPDSVWNYCNAKRIYFYKEFAGGVYVGKTLITGIRATGIPHIGNYLGSIKPVMEMQYEYDIFQIVADLHAIPHVKDPEVLKDNVRSAIACYLACGLDIERTTIWRQSGISEMAWITSIFSSLTTVGEMENLMGFENCKEKDLVSFMYPVLMAADTLMADVDCVLAGTDHKGNLEFLVNLAKRFNEQYGNVLKVPEPVFPPLREMVIGLDGRKMSKSLNNTITILDTEEKLYEIIVNSKLYGGDRNAEPTETALKLLSHFVSDDEYSRIKQSVLHNELDSKELNSLLFTNMNRELAPIRQKYNDVIARPEYIDRILTEGAEKYRRHASTKIQQILQAVGLEH